MKRLVLVTVILSSCAPPQPVRETPGITPDGEPAPTLSAYDLPRPPLTAQAPSPTATGTRPAPTQTLRTAIPPEPLTGPASWFRSPAGVSAAGPRLRAAIGSGWRGTHVKVCSGSRCVRTVLGDWCQCYRGEDRERIIDLDDGVFSKLAPLSRGLQKVTVTW